MATVFLYNLKDLVAGQLKLRWSALNNQLTKADFGPLKLSGLVYDTTLSTKQADIICKLERDIVTFEGTDNDADDKDSIKRLISTAYRGVEQAREGHGHSDDGSTLKCLEDLSNGIENFYTKVQDFPFPLLNIPLIRTPENLVYSHACHYLGLSKFQNDGHGSIEIRRLKEEVLCKRLDALKKSIRPEYTLSDQKETALRLLSDLARDNQDVVKPKKGVKLPLVSSVGVTLFGLSAKPQTASLGSLGKEIILAQDEIKAMTQEQSDCYLEEIENEEVLSAYS